MYKLLLKFGFNQPINETTTGIILFNIISCLFSTYVLVFIYVSILSNNSIVSLELSFLRPSFVPAHMGAGRQL